MLDHKKLHSAFGLLTIAAISLATALAHAQDVEIYRVVPSKILYRQGEDATANVLVKNLAAAARQARLVVVEQQGLDQQSPVFEGDLTLAAGEEKSVQVAWNVGPQMWGRGLQARLVADGKTVSERTEFFSVADEWWRVGIQNGGGSSYEETGKAEKKKLLEYYHLPLNEANLSTSPFPLDNELEGVAPFLNYGNFVHWFAWAPSDFGELTPKEESWHSGQGRYPMNKKEILQRMAAARKFGMKCSAYTANYPGGPAGFEFARQHPEWIFRTETGAFGTMEMPVSPLDMAKPLSDQPAMWCAVNVDGYWPEAVAYGAKELVASSKMFGWDAWYFDCPYIMMPGYSWDGQQTPHGQDPDKLSARNVRIVRDIVLKEFPNTFFWQNGGARVAGKFEAGSYYGGLEGMLAMLEHPQNGSLSEFQGGQLADPNNAMHNWRSLFEIYLAERDARMVKQYKTDISGTVELTGYMYNANFWQQMSKEEFKATRDEWTLSNHFNSLLLALNLHPCELCTWSFRPTTQFMTRYAEFLWDPALKVIRKPGKLLKVESLRELWWEECVYTRQAKGQVDILVHLINSPASEDADIKAKDDPPAADDAELTFNIGDANPNSFQAWALQPYSYDAKRKEPVQVQLKPKVAGKSLVMEIPPFNYYTLVVIRQKP